jgi:hypothetical protein
MMPLAWVAHRARLTTGNLFFVGKIEGLGAGGTSTPFSRLFGVPGSSETGKPRKIPIDLLANARLASSDDCSAGILTEEHGITSFVSRTGFCPWVAFWQPGS